MTGCASEVGIQRKNTKTANLNRSEESACTMLTTPPEGLRKGKKVCAWPASGVAPGFVVVPAMAMRRR
jgi:hypothetical protein